MSVRRLSGRIRTGGGWNFAWGFASQGASSLTNLLLSLLAGRLLGASGLGAIFVGFSYYLLAMGFQRSLITDPLLAATSSLEGDVRRAPTRSALTMTLLLSSAFTVLLSLVAVIVSGQIGHSLTLFIPWLVPALVQDFWRMILFRDRRGGAGALNDTLWLAGMALTLPFVLSVRTDWFVVANWGLGALIATAAGFIQSRVRPDAPSISARWWRTRAWHLGRWLAAETIAYSVASQLIVFLLAAILGTRSLGGLRAVQTIFGPLTLLAPAIALPGLPALARAAAKSADRAVRLALSIGGFAVLLAGVYLAIAATFRDDLLEWVFGRSFGSFGYLMLPAGVGQILVAGTMGFALMLKAQSKGKSLLAARLLGSIPSLFLVLGLALTYGVTGAAWGIALAGGLTSLALVIFSITDGRRGGTNKARTTDLALAQENVNDPVL
jgi:O-antigen/teichoic acid export membrane protein